MYLSRCCAALLRWGVLRCHPEHVKTKRSARRTTMTKELQLLEDGYTRVCF